ncbi:Tim44 domain-containing protein [Salinarimonas soli]|uniref:Tim44 domain-containing protein n=1 Tax=Salinarimonas soli TaxID=1638099 RepID=A0A5B2VTS7_9HYPH|nr:Tim44 domain-containing protein [Salinarimonas soli]KAA2242184.1 Tim44 domain-containing protein [Salinarimonas soli]
MLNHASRRSFAMVALAAILSLAAADVADARAGRSGSFGSRGGRTYQAPPSTPTAPTQARPFDRTITQPGPAQPGFRQPGAPGNLGTQAARPRFGGGFFAGLLGAGLLGALFGAGFFGGLGGLASILGFVLQVLLIGGLIMLALRFFRRRQEPSFAAQQRSALGGMGGPTGGPGPMGAQRSGLGPMGAMGAAAGTRPGPMGGPAAQAPLQVLPADFEAFERNLVAVQAAYDRGDVGTLRTLTTPEMASYFEGELSDDGRRGVKAHVTDVKLLQGDLAEAWRENGVDYATVAMRYQLREGVTERATGRVIEGDPTRLTEATEVWTFRREPGASWSLSGIQQV